MNCYRTVMQMLEIFTHSYVTASPSHVCDEDTSHTLAPHAEIETPKKGNGLLRLALELELMLPDMVKTKLSASSPLR